MKKPLAIPDKQMDAWVLFVHAHARLMARLGADLDTADEVPLGTYDVLVQLSQCGGKLRLKDLLDRVILSQPGLSRPASWNAARIRGTAGAWWSP